MRTTLPLLLVATAVAPVLADADWWPTTTKHWGFTETSDCESTTEWVPPPPPTSTPCTTPEEESTSYSETTVTISVTSCPGGCLETSTLSSLILPTSTPAYAAPSSSSAPALSLTLGAAPTTSLPAPPATLTYSSSAIVTYVNSSSGIVRATPTQPLTASGAVVQSGWSFSAALVGAVGVLFAML
jgi:hypothetical protein